MLFQRVACMLVILLSLAACGQSTEISSWRGSANLQASGQGARPEQAPRDIFDAPAQAGAMGRLEPLPKQDWSAFPWVASALKRPIAPAAGDPNAMDSTIIVYQSQDDDFVEVARYTQPMGSPGNLPIDPRKIADDEAKVVMVGGMLVAGVNRSNVEYVISLNQRLRASQQAIPWALVGPSGAILERGSSRTTDGNFCGSLRAGTVCMYFDGKMQVLQTNMLS